MARWSSRRQAIEARTAELSKQFQADHGREPTNIEAIALAQRATLESREAKHEPRSLAEQRHAWLTEAVEVLGSQRAVTRMIGQTLSATRQRRRAVTPEWITTQAHKAIAVVSESRATWQRHHVLAEAQRIVRATGHAGAADLAEKITAAALDEPISLPLARINDGERNEPAPLRRRDGTSVYTRDGAELYTSAAVVTAERRILHTATLTDGRVTTDEDVALALAESAARGKKLNPGQVTLVTEMATNGRRLALALAPAGAGKTTAMAALSQAWRSSGGRVLGLAPTAAAAIELGSDLNAPTDTLDKYIQLAQNPGYSQIPAWFDTVDKSTLLIIDEAGKAGTLQLDTVISDAIAKGASVRLVGDDGQIASISAGGVLRDIAAETDALTLSQLVRFVAPEEGAASLALRAGDPAGIGFYIDHQRVHVGSDETAADMAFTAWLADTRAGRDSLLLAPTNPIVDDLNARARTARLSATFADNPRYRIGRETILSDQLAASAGDIIRTRENARWLRLSATDYVRNGYRYEILDVADDGSLNVRHLGSDRTLTLPADYVAEHVTLGYATTIDSAQGLTAGYSCHVVGAEHLTRQLLYVALTRGREQNHVYLSTAEHDPHRILSPKATHPDTAVDVLTKILARDGAQISATTAQRVAADPFNRLAAAAEMYQDAVGTGAEIYAGPQVMAVIDEHANTVHPGLTEQAAWPTLRKHLALIAANGGDPIQRLTTAADKRELDTAFDVAAVLDWRLDDSGRHSAGTGPLDWLPEVPRSLRRLPEWGEYLTARATLTAELADHIRITARTWTPATAPQWARPLIDADPDLVAEIAVFRAAFRVTPEDSRLLGADQFAVRARKVQRELQHAAARVIGARIPATKQFAELIDSIDPRLREDSYWPQLADHLANAAPSRPDLARLVRQAAADRPLPDELPAAALWWRLSGMLSHTATLQTLDTHLRPAWIGQMRRIFGSATTETISTDPAWPALVAAIEAADPDTWTPRDLLELAAEHLADAHDHDQSITPYHYARLITHTVDMVTTGDPTNHTHHQAPLPEHAPLSPEEEEELLAHDPYHHTDLGDELPATPPDLTAAHHDAEPPALNEADMPALPGDEPEPASDAEDLGHLEFEDLSPRRVPPPPLPAALLDIAALRRELLHELTNYETLAKDNAILHGPNLRAAMPQIVEMRAAADADLPHFHAVQEVINQWADADAAYDVARAQVEWAQRQLDMLHAQPDPDPLDIASARADLELRRMILPKVSPAERFYPALTAANEARAAAAGGAENIVTHADADKVIAAATTADRRAQLSARRRCLDLRRDLDRAELAAAAAYAAADHRPVDHVLTQQTELDNELRILAAAGRRNGQPPLRLDETASDTPEHSAIANLARMPFTVTVVSAEPSPELTAALTAMHAAAQRDNRGLHWCVSSESTSDTTTIGQDSSTISDLHQRMTAGHWQAQPGDVVLVDSAAAADPAMLADLAEHATDRQARLVLLDTSPPTWPPQPGAAVLQLLRTDLPWTITAGRGPALGTPLSPASSTAPDLQPVLDQAQRLNPAMLPEHLAEALSRREALRRDHRRAFDAFQASAWMRARAQSRVRSREQTPEHDIDQ
ncbi:AAA family ATPase [Mycolicibacterium wolinskyi]|uniref:AAA family ATPase n=1 Tax=Mycolicibacterium wolinskyi TaxID=59750 RepID=UPI000A65E0E9|nr:AAA family ATPase [Mycolicibacterium wolinskyi]